MNIDDAMVHWCTLLNNKKLGKCRVYCIAYSQIYEMLKIIFLGQIAGCSSVRLLEDSVIPPHALRGQKAVMRCNYDLEGDRLYSVKWYYNQKEFYRFIPTDNPKVTIFNNHRGVNVNVSSFFLTKNYRYLLNLKIEMFLNNGFPACFKCK